MSSQFVIKALLAALFALIGAILIIPRTGARPLAIKRLTTLMLVVAAIIAVLNPELLSQLAALLGVGRGTDLVLYIFVVLFFGHVVAARMHSASTDRQLTDLAREIAIRWAPDPGSVHEATAAPQSSETDNRVASD